MKILIIEDDDLIARVYSGKYQSAGFQVAIASDGVHGLELVSTFRPDMVHLDLMVPKLNGVEVIQQIRNNPDHQTLPIVVMTNTYQNRLVKAALDAGATECVSKATCTPKMMLEIVGKYVSRLSAAAPQPSGGAVEPGAAPQVADDAASVEPADEPGNPRPPSSGAELGYTSELQGQAAFQAEVQRSFVHRAPKKLDEMRALVAPLLRTGEQTGAQGLGELFRAVDSLSGQAGIAGFQEMAQMAMALSALLRDLVDDPTALSPSVVHTIAGATDLLSRLLDRASDQDALAQPPRMVLVVDDDPFSRGAVCLALSRLNVAIVSVGEPEAALKLLSENRFSLAFLDIDMPRMTGLELCRELRSLPIHKATPVVFVSGRADEATRKSGAECGGNELIAKPFLPMELAVKALSLLH